MGMASIGNLTGGNIDPKAPGIRQHQGEGQAVSRAQSLKIPNGTTVEGLVLSRNNEVYQVRVGRETLQAKASIPLFIGQRFRAVWDSSQSPPVLRLQQSDLAVIARFTGKDQQIALALLTRGLPIKEEVVWQLRQLWMQSSGNPDKLGALVELWARGLPSTPENIELMLWYMQLSPDEAAIMWKKIKKRFKEATGTPFEKLKFLKEGQDNGEIARFIKAHALAGKSVRDGVDPTMLLAPSWWPVGDGEAPTMARVAISNESVGDRESWWVAFDMEGRTLGEVEGDAMTNGLSLAINLRMESASKEEVVRNKIDVLHESLQSLTLAIQHVGVGPHRKKQLNDGHGVDMEA